MFFGSPAVFYLYKDIFACTGNLLQDGVQYVLVSIHRELYFHSESSKNLTADRQLSQAKQEYDVDSAPSQKKKEVPTFWVTYLYISSYRAKV